MAADRKSPLRGRIEIVVRPAAAKHRRRAEKCLRCLARPFFKAHPRLAHLYLRWSLSHSCAVRLLGWLLGRCAREGASHRHGGPLHTSSSRLHEREEDVQAAADKLGRLLFEVRIRLTVCGPATHADEAVRKLSAMTGAFAQFNSPRLASFHASGIRCLHALPPQCRTHSFLRNSLLTLLEVPGTTLVSLLRLLGDAGYRKAIVARLSDPVVRGFWEHEFAAMHPKFQAEAIAPIQNKVGHFVSSPFLRNIVGQAENRLDLREVMDEGKVLLCNLSKGRIGDDASDLLGALLVTSVQLAAMSRAELPKEERRDFFLYADEFQNFATDSFATILSEARKDRRNLTLANQYLAQVEEQTLAAVFGNVGTLVVFQVGAPDAEILAEQLGGDLEKQDVLTLPRFQAYVRLLIDGLPSRPFSMQTLPPERTQQDPRRADVIRRTSRQCYGRQASRVDQDIQAMFG